MKGKGSATKNKGKKRDEGKKKSKRRASTPAKQEEKKKFKWRPGTVALREIKRYQKHSRPLTASAPFQRRVRSILKELDPEVRIKPKSFECMREATEAYLINILEDSNMCAIHASRKTVKIKDVLLANRIRGGETRAYY